MSTNILFGPVNTKVRTVLSEYPNHLALLFAPRLRGDPVAQGNYLSRMLALGLDLPLEAHGVTWQYTVALLRTLLPRLPRVRLAVLCAENAPELAQALSALDLDLVLHYSQPLKPNPQSPHVSVLPPTPQRPLPQSPRLLEGRLEQYIARSDWLSALNLLTTRLTGLLVARLEPVAEGLQVRGQHARLHDALAALPPELRGHPRVLRWRLSSAIEGWRHQELLVEAEAALASGDGVGDPELRAYFALALYHCGDNARALEEIAKALEGRRSALTLALAGQVYQSANPVAAKGYLNQALRKAEREGRPLLQARAALHLSQVSFQAWEPRASQHWAEWAVRVMAEHGVHNAPLRLEAVNMLVTARLVQGDTAGLESQLAQEAHWLAEANPRLHNVLDWTRAELLHLEGRVGEALEVMAALWGRLRQRESQAMFGVTYVQLLLEAGKADQAKQVAERIITFNDGSDPHYRSEARLAYLIWRGVAQPAAVTSELGALADWFEVAGDGYNALIARLHLARCLTAAGRRGEAEALLLRLEPVALRYGRGLRALVGPHRLFEEIFARFQAQEEALRLEFLGGNRASLYGVPLPLRQRHADILAALALRPEGLTVEQVAEAIYGDPARAPSARTEVKRAKRVVPIAGGPLRIQVEFRADFLEVRRRLRQGDLRGALAHYKGALLPESVAPLIEEERLVLEEMLRSAALSSQDAEALLLAAELLGEDLEVWERAVEALPGIDPRRALAETRRRQIVRDWGLN